MQMFLITIFLLFLGSSVEGCNTSKSSHWPVDCNLRDSLITPDGNNQTGLTTAIYDTVFNANTSNSSVWTSARRLQFNSYWLSIRSSIWGNSSTKIAEIIATLTSYSTNNCEWQTMFLATELSIGSCIWGSIGDFVACGNASANNSAPTTTAEPNCVFTTMPAESQETSVTESVPTAPSEPTDVSGPTNATEGVSAASSEPTGASNQTNATESVPTVVLSAGTSEQSNATESVPTASSESTASSGQTNATDESVPTASTESINVTESVLTTSN